MMPTKQLRSILSEKLSLENRLRRGAMQKIRNLKKGLYNSFRLSYNKLSSLTRKGAQKMKTINHTKNNNNVKVAKAKRVTNPLNNPLIGLVMVFVVVSIAYSSYVVWNG